LILGVDEKNTYVLNLDKLDSELVKAKISQIKKVVGYDVKSTLKIFIELGADLPEVLHDVMTGAFLLNPLRRIQSLDELSSADLGYSGSSLDEIDDEGLIARAAEVTGAVRELYERQEKELSKLEKLNKVAQKIEWPLVSVLAKMEYIGIKLDKSHLERINDQIEDKVSDLEQEIYGYADAEVNIGSPQQLAEVLYVKLGLPTQGIKKGKTGYSTAASELAKLNGLHPIIDLISQWREVTKLKNTYVDTLPEMTDENSRVHTTYNLTVAQTGRLSSADPNLQNIPVRTELGREIRTAFVAGQGKKFVSADYSQQELRLAAYLSEDKELIDMFNRDVDVHVATASQIYSREPQDITKNMRRDAKVVNFGVMYGLGPHGLAQATGMTHEQAKHFIEKYFEVRPKLKEYIEKIREKAKRDGYIETLLGRRRPTPDVHSSNFMVREGAMRAAVNMPFQGSAADIMKLAMVKVAEKLERKDCDILLQIHDSLIVECSEDVAEDIAQIMKITMENVIKLPIKLTVDTTIGKNWGEL